MKICVIIRLVSSQLNKKASCGASVGVSTAVVKGNNYPCVVNLCNPYPRRAIVDGCRQIGFIICSGFHVSSLRWTHVLSSGCICGFRGLWSSSVPFICGRVFISSYCALLVVVLCEMLTFFLEILVAAIVCRVVYVFPVALLGCRPPFLRHAFMSGIRDDRYSFFPSAFRGRYVLRCSWYQPSSIRSKCGSIVDIARPY